MAALVAIYALQQGLSAIAVYVRHALGARFIFDLRVRLYDYLQRLSLSFFGSTATGELMSRVTNDVSALEQFVTHGSAFTVVAVVRLVGAAGVLFWLNWRLALWALIPVPILALSLRAFNERVRPIYCRTRDRVGDINERIRGMRYWSSFFPSMGFVALIGTVVALGLGARMVVLGEPSLGTLAHEFILKLLDTRLVRHYNASRFARHLPALLAGYCIIKVTARTSRAGHSSSGGCLGVQNP